MTGRVLLAWYGYLAIMPRNHLNNVTVTGLARSSRRYDCAYSQSQTQNDADLFIEVNA